VSAEQQLEAVPLISGSKAVENDGVFTHVSVDMQERGTADLARPSGARRRDGHTVTDAGHIYQQLGLVVAPQRPVQDRAPQ